jgi:hypothetical protein
MVHHLADWICRAGRERAIEWQGTPTSLCARCCGFYLAIAAGVWLHHALRRRSGTTVPAIALAVGVGLTVLQVAIEDGFAFADAPALRLGLGAAVGLPLGFIGASRIAAPVRAALGRVAAVVPLAAVAAVAVGAPALLDFALAVGTTLAVVMVVVLSGQIVLDRIRVASRGATKEHSP